MKTIVLGDIIREIVEKTTINNQYPVLTSSQSGLVSQGEYFNKQIASQDNTGYKIIRQGQFTYRAMSDTGRFYINQSPYEIGIVSPAYPVFEIIEDGHVLPEYIATYFRSDPFQNAIALQSTGSTRVSLKLGKIKDISIDIPSVSEQKEILENINEVESLIGSRREQLTKLDELVKSRFIELFGMPGTDTNGWGLIPLGEACQVNPKKGQDKRMVSGLTVSFVPMPAVSEKGEIDPSETREYDTVKTGFTYFAENDVLFAKITPCMENGKGAVARGLFNGIGFGSTEFHVLRPISGKTNPYWIYTLTTFSQFREDAASNMTGSAGQRRVPASFLEKYPVAVPPIELQEQFAAFVEQTDKSKLAIQESLAELETLKKALMQKYFG